MPPWCWLWRIRGQDRLFLASCWIWMTTAFITLSHCLAPMRRCMVYRLVCHHKRTFSFKMAQTGGNLQMSNPNSRVMSITYMLHNGPFDAVVSINNCVQINMMAENVWLANGRSGCIYIAGWTPPLLLFQMALPVRVSSRGRHSRKLASLQLWQVCTVRTRGALMCRECINVWRTYRPVWRKIAAAFSQWHTNAKNCTVRHGSLVAAVGYY